MTGVDWTDDSLGADCLRLREHLRAMFATARRRASTWTLPDNPPRRALPAVTKRGER